MTEENIVDVDLIFKIAAVGIIVSVLNQVLIRAGREEQATMTTLAGIIAVLMMLIYAFTKSLKNASNQNKHNSQTHHWNSNKQKMLKSCTTNNQHDYHG